MGLFSMSGRKKHRTNQGSGYYQPQGFMGKLGGFVGSFSSSDRKRYGHGYPQQNAQPIPGQAQAAPQAQAQAPRAASAAGALSCAQCGATLPPSAKFCPECGTPRG